MAADLDNPARPAGLLRTLGLYFLLLGAGAKARWAYRADFCVMVCASLLLQGVGYVFLWVVFQQLPEVAGWTLHEVFCVYAMIFITEGFVALFCEGLWMLSWIRHRGDFDAVLLRPISPLVQVVASTVGLNWIAGIILGAIMLGNSLQHLDIDWTAGRVALAAVLFVSAVLVRMATVLISSAFGFFIENPFNPSMTIVHNFSQFARFPLSIYDRWLNLVLTFVVPFGFVSYYPVSAVLQKGDATWIGLFTPLVALLSITSGVLLFRAGLRRYEGAGS